MTSSHWRQWVIRTISTVSTVTVSVYIQLLDSTQYMYYYLSDTVRYKQLTAVVAVAVALHRQQWPAARCKHTNSTHDKTSSSGSKWGLLSDQRVSVKSISSKQHKSQHACSCCLPQPRPALYYRQDGLTALLTKATRPSTDNPLIHRQRKNKWLMCIPVCKNNTNQ